ncbi:DNA mismatch repair protein MutS [Falsiroseomonas stagni]|uniref:DNA mismatch repair protein MutS n=1 Tax=Falsiroseomonas stagni DSM 19981 TaxID=1123062 RepID=A0A1I4A387_9PROT|nr:DNA mismatch repair protein MutS [Falsiroseomonas stagni]SFK50852.1 DNA mismatch repair protein MutS [Falsiroseomonas stagni DSM 19981]
MRFRPGTACCSIALVTDSIPPAEGATPALAQWFAAKAQHPDALVFFRMGDFFELFFNDAERAAPVLDIAVAHRGEHRGQPVPMAGVPVHAWEAYLARLIRAGFRVAVCDQMETPEQAKARRASTIRREVVRVVTPSTVTEDGLLDATRPAWLLALAETDGAFACAWLDVSTGGFETMALPKADLGALLARLEPVEAVAERDLAELPDLLHRLPGRIAHRVKPRDPARLLREAFGVATLEGFGIFTEAELAAAAQALSYVRETQAGALPRLDPPRPQAGAAGTLALDAATRRSLEILRDQRGGDQATLFGAVNATLTAAGARELAGRLAAPLAEAASVSARHDAVSFLLGAEATRGAIRASLKGAPDMARALARLALDRFAPRDLAALLAGLRIAASLRDAILSAALPAPALMAEAAAALAVDPSLEAELSRALNLAKMPARLEDGGVIAPGFDGELDALRRLRDGGRDAIAALQQDLAQAWGIAAVKIRHHQQFGFLAEVPAAPAEKLLRASPVPAGQPLSPIHRQTMANAVRFTCPALAELDRKVAEAGDRAAARERACIAHLKRLVLAEGDAIARAARALADIDVHAASATLAAEGGWCRPELTERAEFAILAGRHPVVEAMQKRARGAAFVPNDCDLSPGRRLCLLTGPNMAGKSTWLRQNALMVVLAQAGLFVPAQAARIGLVDRLFSRVGGGDDIAGGRSTFMVEMAETAAILNQATARSLVVLDEVGRGTATWDGLAIAWAVLEALHDRIRCRAIFATHFHELTALAGRLPDVALASMKVREWRGEVVFQHLVGPGASERSWGVHVARLAGVPRPVLARANQVLSALEARARGGGPDALAEELPLFAQRVSAPARKLSPIEAALAAMDLDALSPREAQEALYRLKALSAEVDAAQQENPVAAPGDTVV